MSKLNLPQVDFKVVKENDKFKVFDVFRSKYVVLTPEEWVRQNFVHYLVNNRSYPAGLIAIEHLVVVNQLKQRADVVVYNHFRKPVAVVECKAPSIPITKAVFDQALRYNMVLGVELVIVTNGLVHLAANIDGDSYKML